MFWDVSGLSIFHFLCFTVSPYYCICFFRVCSWKCNMRWGFRLNLIPLLDRGSFWDFVVLIFNITLLKSHTIWPIKPYLTHPSPIFLFHFAQQKTTPRIKSSSTSTPPVWAAVGISENDFHWPRNATVYDAAHQILAQLGHVTLPQRIALAEASQVGRDSKAAEKVRVLRGFF